MDLLWVREGVPEIWMRVMLKGRYLFFRLVRGIHPSNPFSPFEIITCIYERWVGYIPKSIVTAESQHVHFNVKCQKTMSVGHFLNKKKWDILNDLSIFAHVQNYFNHFDIRHYYWNFEKIFTNWTKLNSTKLNLFLPFYQKFKLFEINHFHISKKVRVA